MHPTAMINAKAFFDTYSPDVAKVSESPQVIEIGSQDVNGSLRAFAPPNFEYIGVDFVDGKGVDLILDDPYELPFADNTVDVVISSSCFEHSEMFWVLFLEVLRVLKPTGIFYLNAPSNGEFHRWPVDCWRFYPDSGNALVRWANRNKVNAALLESYTSEQIADQWNDFVAVFLKDSSYKYMFTNRILNSKKDITNGLLSDVEGFVNYRVMPQDKL